MEKGECAVEFLRSVFDGILVARTKDGMPGAGRGDLAIVIELTRGERLPILPFAQRCGAGFDLGEGGIEEVERGGIAFLRPEKRREENGQQEQWEPKEHGLNCGGLGSATNRIEWNSCLKLKFATFPRSDYTCPASQPTAHSSLYTIPSHGQNSHHR